MTQSYYERAVSRTFSEHGLIWQAELTAALATAARLRMALGDSEQAARDVERFDQLFGQPRRRAPEFWRHEEFPRSYQAQAAELRLELGAHYGERRDLAWQARYWERTLRAGSVRQSLPHRIRAEVKLAQVRWQQSCPVAGKDGLCVDPTPLRLPHLKADYCDARWIHLERPRVRERNAALAAAALQGTRRALASYPVELVLLQRRGGEAQLHLGDAALVEAVEAALLIQADQRYERFLAAAPFTPAFPRLSSKRQISSWIQVRQARLDALRPGYRDLMDLSDGDAGSAAAARLAQSFHLFWADLVTTPMSFPRQPPRPTGSAISDQEWKRLYREAYCDSVEGDRAPTAVTEDYSACIQRAARLGRSSPWQAQCERGANLVSATEWPIPSEIYPTETDIPIRMEQAEVQSGTKSAS
jgi:hypothetical protein